MICNNKKQVFMGGSPKAKSTDFTPAFFLLQDVFLYIPKSNLPLWILYIQKLLVPSALEKATLEPFILIFVNSS